MRSRYPLGRFFFTTERTLEMAARRSSGSSFRYSSTVFVLLCTMVLSFHEITGQALRLEDLDVRFFGNGQEVVDHIAFHQTAITPVIRQADLMDDLTVDLQRRHARRDQGSRVDRAACGRVGPDFAVEPSDLRGRHRRECRATTRL